jgi:hypothetical protein
VPDLMAALQASVEALAGQGAGAPKKPAPKKPARAKPTAARKPKATQKS